MNPNHGFTLIELLIVIAIIGILAAVLIPNLLGARARANDQTTAAYLRNCLTAVETKRDGVTAEFPANIDGAQCSGPELDDMAQLEPAAIIPGSSVITLQPDGSVVIEARSATGKLFSYNGQQYTVTP